MKNFIKSFLLCVIVVVSFPQYSNAGGMFTSEEDKEEKRTPRRARVQQVYNPFSPYVRSNYGLVRFLGASLYCMIHPVCYIVDWATRPALQNSTNNTPTRQQSPEKKKKEQEEKQEEKDIPKIDIDFQDFANAKNGENPKAGPETQNKDQERGDALTKTVEKLPSHEQIETQTDDKGVESPPTKDSSHEQTGSAKTSHPKGNSTDNVTVTDEIVIVPTSSALDRNMKRRIKDEEEKENREVQPNIIHSNSPKDYSAATIPVSSGSTFNILEKSSVYSPKKFRQSPSNHRPPVVTNLSTKETPTDTPEKERRGENYLDEMLIERKSLLDAFGSMEGEDDTTDDNSEDSSSHTD